MTLQVSKLWVGRKGTFHYANKNVAWTHPAFPGVEVRHCQHPTALRPWYVAGGADNAKFRLVVQAKWWVEHGGHLADDAEADRLWAAMMSNA